jgi:protein-L-isoaspartate(D-aspartate) O-methyltransferase
MYAKLMDNLANIRRRYAEQIRAAANLRSEALVDAFAKVSREHFLGSGSWQIVRTEKGLWQKFARRLYGSYRTTPDANPKHLYQNVLVAIDASRNLNNGLPSGIAFWLDALDLHAGERVLHVGCGVGYYTAIIAEVVGTAGQVIGIEIDPELASRARANLSYLNRVEVLQGDGAKYNLEPFDAIFINAGATHPQDIWLDGLKFGGRLILPLTTDAGKGGMLKVEQEKEGYTARFISTVSVFPCIGSRDASSNQLLRDALKRKPMKLVESLRRETHEANDTCWLHGIGFCLSMLPMPKSKTI